MVSSYFLFWCTYIKNPFDQLKVLRTNNKVKLLLHHKDYDKYQPVLMMVSTLVPLSMCGKVFDLFAQLEWAGKFRNGYILISLHITIILKNKGNLYFTLTRAIELRGH